MPSMENKKQPFKLVEIPVNNFKDVAIPHHLKLLSDHKEIVQKENNDAVKMKNEHASIKRIIAQLKGLLYELDTLRAQVQDEDLDKFDMKTVSLRKNILQIISEYTELLKHTSKFTNSPKKQSSYETNEDPLLSPKQLQIVADIDELKLEDKENCLKNVEDIQNDIHDLHSMYGTLHSMVNDQKEQVNAVEDNTESAQNNVNAGSGHIITAARLKASVYPVTGAIVGTCIGGPLGLIAGLKVGGIAAVGCGFLGFVGGKFLKTRKVSITNVETPSTEEQEISDSTRSKKEE